VLATQPAPESPWPTSPSQAKRSRFLVNTVASPHRNHPNSAPRNQRNKNVVVDLLPSAGRLATLRTEYKHLQTSRGAQQLPPAESTEATPLLEYILSNSGESSLSDPLSYQSARKSGRRGWSLRNPPASGGKCRLKDVPLLLIVSSLGHALKETQRRGLALYQKFAPFSAACLGASCWGVLRSA